MIFRNSTPRAGAWSTSKYTNSRKFSPQSEEISRVIEKYYWDYQDRISPLYRQMRLHPDFIMPVTLHEVKVLIGKMPSKYTQGLKAVFLLGGAKQQEKSWSNFCYGRCARSVIYLHPYPKSRMTRRYKHSLKPHVLQEYVRAGATIEQSSREFRVIFDRYSLRKFYLRDVLMHEIGHHVDRANFNWKRESRIEPFAEWFATEYGFRLWG